MTSCRTVPYNVTPPLVPLLVTAMDGTFPEKRNRIPSPCYHQPLFTIEQLFRLGFISHNIGDGQQLKTISNFHLNQAGLGTACVNHQGGSFTMWNLSKWFLIYIYNLKGVGSGSQLFVNIQMACKSWHCTNKVMKEKIDDFLICFNNEMVLCSLKSILSVVNNNICVALSCKTSYILLLHQD